MPNKPRLIVTIAVGEQYLALENRQGPAREAYAKSCNADYLVITELDPRIKKIGLRHSYTLGRQCILFKLLIPSLTLEYNEVVFADNDSIFSPQAPNVFLEFEKIPSGNIGAVQDATKAERAKYFPTWTTSHYDFLSDEHRKHIHIPFGDLYINSGLLLFRPTEVVDRWKKLLDQAIQFFLVEEDVINCFEVQNNLVTFLDRRWNVIWLYEKYRKNLLHPHQRKKDFNHLMTLLKNRVFWKLWEPKEIRKCLQESYLLHLAFEHRKAYSL